MKLNVKAFAVTAGLCWSTGLFFIAWWIMLFEGATGERTLLGQLYPGYAVSPMGSLIGLAWGAFDGLIGGAVFAWLYNLIAGWMAPPE
ncbi:MAG: bacteriophage holin [Nitrospirota bacterium]